MKSTDPKRPVMHAVIGCSYILIGVILALLVRRSTWSVSIVRVEPEWYQSDYLPLWIACIVFGAVSIWIRLPILEGAIYGFLVTGPPYGWLLWLLIEIAKAPDAEASAIANVKAMRPLVACLALSGTVLNPLLSVIVGRVKQRLWPSDGGRPAMGV